MLSRFTSDAGNNFVNFSSTAYDETYARAHAAVDDAEKTELYKECLRILAEECASVYIQDLPSFVVLANRFTGYEFYPLYAQNIATIRPAE
jgi:peptide/nickel transport system substrate-binding protein